MQSFQEVPISSLRPSTTNPRKTFAGAELHDLAASIKERGVLQPLLVRHTLNDDGFEIVAGERRWRAAMIAGLAQLPVMVRELTDVEALEAQVIENLQREDVPPIEEAEGYEAILKLGEYDVNALAAKVGKSGSYVYKRLKLCALIPPARKAMREGTITPSVALILARIPAKLQPDALEQFGFNEFDGLISQAQASRIAQDDFMLVLSSAQFKTEDETLVPKAGKCSACPKRTGNQPELFSDIKGRDLCTDPVCFKEKTKAGNARKLTEAKAEGRTVITGKEAKKLVPTYGQPGGGFVRLDDHCHDDSKNRTYRQILGKSAPPATLAAVDRDGEQQVIELVRSVEIKPLLEEKGIKKGAASARSDDGGSAARWRAAEKKARLESQVRVAILAATVQALGAGIRGDELHEIAMTLWDRTWHDNQKRIITLRGWKDKSGKAIAPSDAAKLIAAMDDGADVARLLRELVLITEVGVNLYSIGGSKPTKLLAAADRAHVDHVKIRADLEAAAKEKTKPKKKPAPAKKTKAKK